MNIVVIHSGQATSVLRRTFATREWEGYYENAASISQALESLGHSVAVVPDGIDLIASLAHRLPDMAWICSGGIQGRDQACHLPAILESLGIPYVGSTPLVAGMSDDKTLAKALVAAAGLDTPPSISVRVGEPIREFGFNYPVVAKPNNGLCSCGVSKVSGAPQLLEAVAKLHKKYRSTVLVESYIDGLDISVPVLQRESLVALPAVQRRFRWKASQTCEGWTRPHPASEMLEGPASLADLPLNLRQLVSEAAVAACTAIGIRHLARVDFRLDGSRCYFLEANSKPDLTSASLFALSAANAGIDYPSLIQSILNVARLDSPGVGDGERPSSQAEPEGSNPHRRVA